MGLSFSKGWFQVAFESELTQAVCSTRIAHKPLMLARTAAGLRAFDATCPHRGANLSIGGVLAGEHIRCPFHHYAIRLGSSGECSEFAVREYALLSVGGLVFVRLSDEYENGLTKHLESLISTREVINGFRMQVKASPELIIENAFDRLHFYAVHGVRTESFTVTTGGDGELVVESVFYVPGRGGGMTKAPFVAIVVSPTISIVELQGPVPYTVITSATDLGNGSCDVRLSLAIPKDHFPQGVPAAFYEPLLAHSRRGIEEDRVIWENIAADCNPQWVLEDHAAVMFSQFCKQFIDE